MRLLINFPLLLFFFWVISGCEMNDTKYFTNINSQNNQMSSGQRLNGLYFITQPDSGIYKASSCHNGVPYAGIYYYADGTVYCDAGICDVENVQFNVIDYEKRFISSLYLKREDYEPWWGAYKLNKDSFSIQFLDYKENVFYKRKVTELTGYFIDNFNFLYITKIIYYKHSYNKISTQNYAPPLKYIFHEYNNKPDSSKAWFKKEKWYKKAKGLE